MRILAIDTSCGAASVAMVESDMAEPLAVLSRPMARGHADALAPMVEEAMRGVEGGFASLGRIAVTTGPGSFTGIRVGLAMARAMGLALAIPVIGVSTLVAFAAPLLPSSGPDRRRGDRRPPRLGLFPTFRGDRPPLGPPRCDTARECVRAIGPARRGWRATRPHCRMRRTEPACLTTSTRRETRRTLSPWRGWALPSTLRRARRARST